MPSACRKAIYDSLHDPAHPGIDSCLRRARDPFNWPCMNAEIKEYIKSCSICADYQLAQTPEPMLQPVKPSRLWEVVSPDIFNRNGKDYLVTVNHFSGFFEMEHLHNITLQSVINKLKPHFARYGSPTKFLTDNARQLVSDESETFFQILEVQAPSPCRRTTPKATEWRKLWSKLRSPF